MGQPLVTFVLFILIPAALIAYLWASSWHGDPYDPCQFRDDPYDPCQFRDLCRREDDE